MSIENLSKDEFEKIERIKNHINDKDNDYLDSVTFLLAVVEKLAVKRPALTEQEIIDLHRHL